MPHCGKEIINAPNLLRALRQGEKLGGPPEIHPPALVARGGISLVRLRPSAGLQPLGEMEYPDRWSQEEWAQLLQLRLLLRLILGMVQSHIHLLPQATCILLRHSTRLFNHNTSWFLRHTRLHRLHRFPAPI